MKKGVSLFLVFILIGFLCLGFISANWFTDAWGKITGNVIAGDVLATIDLSKISPMHYTPTCPSNTTLASYSVGPFEVPVVISTSTSICVDDYLSINGNIVTNTVQNTYCSGAARTAWAANCTPAGKNLTTIPANTKINLVIYDTVGVYGGANGTIQIKATSSSASNSTVPDLTPPVISNIQPTGTINSTSVNISLATDENATCKYSQDQNTWTTFFNTGKKAHTQYFTSLPNGQNTFYVRCKDSSGNENQVSSIVSFTVSTPTCTDSDGGINYYVKGRAWGNYQGSFVNNTDACGLNINDPSSFGEVSSGPFVGELYCSGNELKVNYSTCPNGCFNGACYYPGYFISFQHDNYTSDENLDYKLVPSDLTKPAYIDLYFTNGDSKIKIKSSLLINNSFLGSVWLGQYPEFFNKEGYYALLVCDAGSSCEGNIGGTNSNQFYVFLENEGQVCSSLIGSVKNPTSTENRKLSWNSTYSGSTWIGNNEESYKEYSSSWYWNSEQYQENQINYYYASYNVQVFDNKEVNLSEFVSWNENSPACKKNSYGSDERENAYYVCNWDIIYSNQDVSNNYQGNNREVFWYKDNVAVRIYLYWGNSLTDEQVSKIQSTRIVDLLDSLKNNNYEYVDWNNFQVDYPASNELYSSFNSCPSDISLNWSTEPSSWNCKTEPVICPEHGYQTKTCRRWNPQLDDYETQTNQIDCSPGLCSGCYVPKWFGGSDNKCIPYGFRFGQDTGQFEWINVTRTYGGGIHSSSDLLFVYQIEHEGEDEITLTIYPDNSMDLRVASWDNQTHSLVAGSELDLLKLINYSFYDPKYAPIQELFKINSIYYDASNYSNSYFNYTIIEQTPTRNYTHLEEKAIQLNLYCDIDGKVKQQKAKNSEGGWATCQNNYECRSNICSEGECIEVISIFKQAKEFFVKMLCKLSNPFSDEGYTSCVAQYSS